MDTTHSTDRIRGRRFRANVVALGAAAGMTLAGFGMAAAQTDDPPAPAQARAQAEAQAPTQAPAGKGGTAPAGKERAARPHKGPGRAGLHGALHGEFVTRTPDGEGFQTLAVQRGEVTDVNASSLTVRSEDGYSRTYAVTDDTLVNAGNDGIADVEAGDQVAVTARVADGKATAVDVRDATKVRELRGRWAPAPGPGRPGPPGEDGEG